MATVKKTATRKAPVKKAAAKPADVKPAPARPEAGLSADDRALIAQIAAESAAQAVKDILAENQRALDAAHTEKVTAKPLADLEKMATSHVPGGKKVANTAYETEALTPAAIANMTPEQIEEYNRREQDKMRARKARQASTLAKLSDMSTGDRVRYLTKERDPSVIRMAVPDDWDGNENDLVRVICKRHVGLGGGLMSDIDEEVDMYRPAAKNLQKTGAVEVSI
jgi:hypothetical protein